MSAVVQPTNNEWFMSQTTTAWTNKRDIIQINSNYRWLHAERSTQYSYIGIISMYMALHRNSLMIAT